MDDAISRTAAIDALNEYFSRIGKLKRRGLSNAEKAISLDTVGAIKSLPPAQQWIPCSERLPEKDGEYLVTMLYFGEKTVEVDMFSHYETDDEHNGEPFWMYGYDNVIAWMPRPEAWKGDKHEAE